MLPLRYPHRLIHALVRRIGFISAFSFTCAFAFSSASGQTASPVNSPSDPKEETLHLAPFEVSSNSQTGYMASESMTGSRIPTKIKDLPFTIDVITKDFMDDFAILDFSQVVQGGMITTDQDAGSSYTIRGISSSGQLYNGFWQPAGTPVPTALRDRTEILNGPSAGVYGQTSPGGMLNIVSKQPKTTPSATLRLTGGSYNLFDSRLEATGPVTSKTSYLAIIDYNERAFNQPWHEDRSKTAAFSLQHRFDDSSNLSFEFVGSVQRNHSPSNRVPYYYNSSAGKYYGIAYELMNVSGTGPTSYKNNDNFSVFGVYEKRFNDIFSFRLGSNAYSFNSRSFNTTDVTSYDPDPTHANTNPYSSTFYGLTRLRSATSSYSPPSYQVDNREGGGTQGDLLAHYWAFNHKVENRTLFTFDYASFYEYIQKKGMPQSVKTDSKTGLPTVNAAGAPSTNNAVDTNLFPLSPLFAGDTSYWQPVINPYGAQTYTDPKTGLPVNTYNVPSPGSSQYALRSVQKTRRDVFGLMLRHQATLWDRLLLFGTLRFDNVLYNIYTAQYQTWSLATYPTLANYTQQNYPQGSVAHFHSDAFTGSGGINYRVTKGLSLYSNYSTSFVPSTQVVSGATTGSYILPNETAEGYDYGLKGSLIDESLTFTLGGFYIDQQHVSVTADDPNGFAIKQAVGEVVSKGFEATANYFITSNLAVNVGYFNTDARWHKTGNDLDLVGRRKANVPQDMATCATKYNFDGFLKGVSVTGLLQYVGRSNAQEGGNLVAAGGNIAPPGSNNGLREIVLPSYTVVNVGAAYSFRSHVFSKALNQKVQFNVNNLLDRKYVTFSRGAGDHRGYYLTYQTSY